MARIFHEHKWNLIPEDSFYLRSTMKEQLALYGLKPGGLKYKFMIAPEGRWETHTTPIWSRMATNHPTISVSYQGSNVGDTSAIPGLNLESRIDVAVPMYRFVGANMVKEIGEDRLAATFCDLKGTHKFANNQVTLNESIVTYANPATGELSPLTQTSRKKINTGSIQDKYGEERTYTCLANGSPVDMVIPMNDRDEERDCAVWDTAAIAEDGTTGDFVSVKMSDSKAFDSTNKSMRSIVPSEKILGLSMIPIPTNKYFDDVISGDQAPIPDLRMFDYTCVPTWIGTIPFLAGKFTNAGGSNLIAAGDILPGGIVYDALMRKRSYSYLAFPYKNDNEKYPTMGTYLGVGPFGEIQVGTDSYFPLLTNSSTGNFTKTNTNLVPGDVAGGNPPTIYTQFNPSDYAEHTLFMTNIADGSCGEATINALATGSVTVGATATVTNGACRVTAKLSSKKIIGVLDSIAPGLRNTLSATHNNILNIFQGYDKTVNILSEYVYNIYKEHKRIINITLDGVATTIDFEKGTKVSGGAAAVPYTANHFMVDIANQGLIGHSVVRVDVFKDINVAK